MENAKPMLFPQLDAASLFTILMPNRIALKQCTVLMNCLYLPVGFPVRTLTGYFTKLNFDDQYVVLEKHTPHGPVYYILNSQERTIDGPMPHPQFVATCPPQLPLKELRDFPWYDLNTSLHK